MLQKKQLESVNNIENVISKETTQNKHSCLEITRHKK